MIWFALGEQVAELALSPDGALLAVADEGHLTLRDPETLALVRLLQVDRDVWSELRWDEGWLYASSGVERWRVRPDGSAAERLMDGSRYRPSKLGDLRFDAPGPAERLDSLYLDWIRSCGPLPRGVAPTAIAGGWAADDHAGVHRCVDGAVVRGQVSRPLVDLAPAATGAVGVDGEGGLVLIGPSGVELATTRVAVRDLEAAAFDLARDRVWLGEKDGGLTVARPSSGKVLATLPGVADLREADARGDALLILTSDGATRLEGGRPRWTVAGDWFDGSLDGRNTLLVRASGEIERFDRRGRSRGSRCAVEPCSDEAAPVRLERAADGTQLAMRAPRRSLVSEWADGAIVSLDGGIRVPLSVVPDGLRLGERLLSCEVPNEPGDLIARLRTGQVDALVPFEAATHVQVCDHRFDLSLDGAEPLEPGEIRPGTVRVVVDRGTGYDHFDHVAVGAEPAWVLADQGGSTRRQDAPSARAELRLGTRVKSEGDRLLVYSVGSIAEGGLLLLDADAAPPPIPAAPPRAPDPPVIRVPGLPGGLAVAGPGGLWLHHSAGTVLLLPDGTLEAAPGEHRITPDGGHLRIEGGAGWIDDAGPIELPERRQQVVALGGRRLAVSSWDPDCAIAVDEAAERRNNAAAFSEPPLWLVDRWVIEGPLSAWWEVSDYADALEAALEAGGPPPEATPPVRVQRSTERVDLVRGSPDGLPGGRPGEVGRVAADRGITIHRTRPPEPVGPRAAPPRTRDPCRTVTIVGPDAAPQRITLRAGISTLQHRLVALPDGVLAMGAPAVRWTESGFTTRDPLLEAIGELHVSQQHRVVVHEGVLYVQSSGGLQTIDLATGAWRGRLGEFGPLAARADGVWSLGDRAVDRLDASGAVVESLPLPQSLRRSGNDLHAHGDQLWVQLSGGWLHHDGQRWTHLVGTDEG